MRLISFAAIEALVGAEPALIRADEGQWKPLFDGKSLAGWKQRGGMARYRASGEEISGFDEVGHQNSVDQEAGAVLHDDGELADLLHEANGALQDGRRSLASGDDFDQLPPSTVVLSSARKLSSHENPSGDPNGVKLLGVPFVRIA